MRKSPDKIVLHVQTNDVPHATPQDIFSAIKYLKSFIQKYDPESKIIVSMSVLQVDKTNVNDINKRYINLLKEVKLDCITELILISMGYILISQYLLFSQRI